MAYSSSALTTDVLSSYLYFDNLRTDIAAGKTWNASDGTETKNTQIGHDGTDGTIKTSSGDILLKPAGGNTRAYDTAGTKYLDLYHDGTDGYLKTSNGVLCLFGYNTSAAMKIYGNLGVEVHLPTAGGVFRIYERGAIVDRMDMYHDGTNAYITNNAGMFYLKPTTHVLRCGTSGTRSYLSLFDSTLAAWKTIHINNGVVVVT